MNLFSVGAIFSTIRFNWSEICLRKNLYQSTIGNVSILFNKREELDQMKKDRVVNVLSNQIKLKFLTCFTEIQNTEEQN